MNKIIIFIMCVFLFCSTMYGGIADTSLKNTLNKTLPEIKFSNVAIKDCFDFLRDISGANIHVHWNVLNGVGVTPEMPVNIRLRQVTLSKVMNLLLSECGATSILTYYIDDGVIEVTTKEMSDKQMITKVYNVEDLLIESVDFESSTNFALNSGNNGNNYNGYGNSNNINNDNINNRNGNVGNGNVGNGNIASGNTEKPTQSKSEKGEALIQLIIELIRPEIWRQNGGTAGIRFFNGNLIVTAPRSVHEEIGGDI